MPTLRYFAYGSNMLRERVIARSVVLLDRGQPACAEGYRLLFNKKSDDGSAKANIDRELGTNCWGVLYSVDASSLTDLDAAEAAPDHYRRENIFVKIGTAEQEATTYLAQPQKTLTIPERPYDWYLALILAGAKACSGMPSGWIAELRRIGQSKPDSKSPLRKTFTEAVAQLKTAGCGRWEDL
jgi:gamma-glutamylcyclotransferase (GGCT)/AIG2-like uncharacterized protein YtfP